MQVFQVIQGYFEETLTNIQMCFSLMLNQFYLSLLQ